MTNDRTKSIATLMLIANITFKLGNELTHTVNSFRRSLRKYLNKLQKHEKKLYKESQDLASKAWETAYNSREENLPNLSVASTLDSLNLLIEDVKFVKKIYTQKQFIQVYSSIVQDKGEPVALDVEKASKEFTEVLAASLGFEKKNNLKRLIYTLKQNRIAEGKDT